MHSSLEYKQAFSWFCQETWNNGKDYKKWNGKARKKCKGKEIFPKMNICFGSITNFCGKVISKIY